MAQISIRVEDEVKKSAEQTLDAIGLSMSTAINIFLKTVAREKRIPFELSADPFYSKSNMEYLEKIVAGINDGTAKLAEHDLIEAD
ncbi:MAG: type II toxin-antitoxin system RelB/DinJ family antitoxin [Clostridium sp.]|nr:type II toxin-antitoxin system RelB/DinJ family antitoxin [Clostridium sp.]